MKIRIEDLVISESWNCRESYGDVAALARSMANDGQITPIVINESKFLIAGFRRVRAAKSLGWVEITAQTVSADDSAARYLNLTENVLRKNLSSYELARSLAQLRSQESTGRIAERLGLSEPYVRNLVYTYQQLDPRILAEWKNNHPAATLNRLYRLRVQPPTEQMDGWLSLIGAYTGGGPVSAPRRRKGSRSARPSLEKIQCVLGELEKRDAPQGVIAALRFAAGATTSIEVEGKTLWP